mgnify:CR=1 FL=1|jgi:hypothetical protein
MVVVVAAVVVSMAADENTDENIRGISWRGTRRFSQSRHPGIGPVAMHTS